LSYKEAVLGRRRLVAGAALLASFAAASPALAAAQLGSRLLYPGMRGADVRTLQQDLSVSGFTTRVTGVFNRPTETRVIAFQRRYHLSADGVVGPQTAHELRTVTARFKRASSQAKTADTTTSGADGTGTSQAQKVDDQPQGTDPTPPTNSGGSSAVPPPSSAPVQKATIDSQGLAVAPSGAPVVIREVIAAANKIAFKPYVYGGGHGSFTSSGYDCSGSVSYALHGGGLLSSPEDSSEFETYGNSGLGRWITLYTNAGHVYMHIAGLWFDTAAQSSSNNNSRWSTTRISPSSGFMIRHPAGW
jgi:peptidoglycan hydrolase-like protein with peptidoglycan-binding domain